jgi:adenosine deaminase
MVLHERLLQPQQPITLCRPYAKPSYFLESDVMSEVVINQSSIHPALEESVEYMYIKSYTFRLHSFKPYGTTVRKSKGPHSQNSITFLAADADADGPVQPKDGTTNDDDHNDSAPEVNREKRDSWSMSASHEALHLDRDVREFLKRIPKVELHAHLNGCVREATLLELARERGVALCPRLFPSCSIIDDESTRKASHPESCDSLHTDDPASSSRLSTSISSPAFYHRRPRSLADCFEVFVEISKVVEDLEALRRITTEALQDFADEGAAYVELRSTPKRLRRRRPRQRHRLHDGDDTSNNKDDEASHLDDLVSKREYVETILAAMGDFERDQQRTPAPEQSTSSSSRPRYPMHCRLLVAIDRSRSLEEAQEHVDLAISFLGNSDSRFPSRVVGIDVGGNPCRGDLRTFFPLLRRAKEAGLFVTLHCAEVSCGGDDDDDRVDDETTALSPSERVARREAEAILELGQFVPDRIGHALLLPPRLQRRLLQLGIPVETCPTSNVMTLELAQSQSQMRPPSDAPAAGPPHHHVAAVVADGLSRHPQLRPWLEHGHPLAICTDDPGVFGTTLTREWELLVATHASSLVRGFDTKPRDEEGSFGTSADEAGHRFGRHLRRSVARMMARSMDFAFCDDRLKDEVRELILGSLDAPDGQQPSLMR